MEPTAIFEGMIADMIDYELAERNTQAVVREQSVEEEQASRLVDGFQPNIEDTFIVEWPTTEEECPYADLGTKCDPVCVYCDMKRVCMHCALKSRSEEVRIDPPCPFRIPGCRSSTGAGPCALKSRSAEVRIDPPCPLRIPGCRCPTGAGPSISEYYCSTGDPFMGAYVLGEGEEKLLQEEIEDEEYFEETREEDVVDEETDDDDFLKEVGDRTPLNDETGSGDIDENKTPPLFSSLTPWPLLFPATFWNGLVPGWEQGLPPPSQPQVDYNGYSDFLSEPLTMDPQNSVAADQHARAGRAKSSINVLQLPIAYNGYSPFLPGSAGLTNQVAEAASQNALIGNPPSSGKPVGEESRPQAHQGGADHKRAAVGKGHSSQQPAIKKDSRGWEEHEKAFVKTLMLEVISEGTYARTEERWKVISRRLSDRYSIDRTWTAVKNFWNRHGRSDTNIDERRVKKPDRMVTGVQDPESRRQARHLKRKDGESDNGNDLVELDDDDDDGGSDSAPPSKRQRLERARAW